MTTEPYSVGGLLRDWRKRRRFSQLDLSSELNVSSRHLSFVETGRSLPSRGLLLRVADRLDMPLRERNRLLVAAGLAPEHAERHLATPEMAAIREAVDAVLAGHEPYPALVFDRHWNISASNGAMQWLVGEVAPHLLAPSANALRLALSPDGLAPRIENLAEWRRHLLHRLDHQAATTGDRILDALHDELVRLPFPASQSRPSAPNMVAVPLLLWTPDRSHLLSLISTTTVFGTAVDVALAELTLECFYPADPETRAILQVQGCC
jgi:transcriptional regulator with XRE-family HTH domain